MSTVTPNLDHITLDPGDPGIHWIPGVGFRPVDMTEELPFFNQMDCDIIDTGTQCIKGNCSFGKGDEKYNSQPIISFYTPETISYTTPHVPMTPIIWDTPWWDELWDPPTWECCTITTTTPDDITHIPSYTPSVPIGGTSFLLLTALVVVVTLRRFT